jgi:hypothetical protein
VCPVFYSAATHGIVYVLELDPCVERQGTFVAALAGDLVSPHRLHVVEPQLVHDHLSKETLASDPK